MADNLDNGRLVKAFALACDFHALHKRKGTTIPYISHLMATAAIVMEHGGSEDAVLAALLHDAIEDAGGPTARQLIARELGEGVAQIVSGCSDTDTTDSAGNKPPWKQRKTKYIEHVRAERDVCTRLVSAADKLHNARSLLSDYRTHGEHLWSRFNAPRKDILWYYEELIDAFRRTQTAPALVNELERVIGALREESEPSKASS